MSLNIDLLGMRALEIKPHADRVLEAALIYARSGARVMPLYPNTKMPALDSWSEATSDPATLRDWFSKGGKHYGGNIALLVNGFTVIDIDRHGDLDGFKTLNGALDNAACPRSSTPNDGEHLLASKTDVTPAPGVEILGEGKLFTVYPSQIDGKRYMWKSGGVPSPVQRIRAVEKTPTSATAVPVAPAGYLVGLLEHVDPGTDYGTWLKVGMALHHNDAGMAGLTVWDDWSQGSSKYKDGECERRWTSFDAARGKPTTLRWLIIEALKNGRSPTPEDILYHGNLFGSIAVDRVNEKYGIYDMNGKVYIVYQENGNVHFADAANFRLKIADWKVEADGKLKPMSDVWLEHPDRRLVTDIGMWEPGTEPDGALNYYAGLAVKPVPCEEEEISLFLDFCRDDICRGNVRYYDYLMDMLAAKLQHPLRLMKLCLVLRGGEGAGKGALTRVMENIIGQRHSVNVSSANSWLGQYGTFLKNSIWISANEAYWSGNHQQAERLKALVTESEIDIEEKYIHIKKYKNRVMVAITSNNQWGVPAGHDSRRFFVLDVSNRRANDPPFWDEFHAKLGAHPDTGELNDPEYLGKVLYWFKNRKIKSDLKRALETEWLIRQRRETAIESREDAFIMWVRSTFVGERSDDIVPGAGGFTFVKMQRASDGVDVVKADKVYEDYRAYINKNHKRPRMTFDNGTFNETMLGLGFDIKRVVKSRILIGGKRSPEEDNGAKITVMSLPSADQIEAAISSNFALFGQTIGEEE